MHNLSVRLPEDGRGELGEISGSFNSMLDRLDAQISSQKEFLGDVGHELRTPLTVLRGHVELLPQDSTEADRNQTVLLLLDEIDRMSRLVDELSLLARSERPEFLNLSPFKFETFTTDMFCNASMAAGAWQLTNRGTGMVEADPDRLTQCLMNLADNAVRHTGPEDPSRSDPCGKRTEASACGSPTMAAASTLNFTTGSSSASCAATRPRTHRGRGSDSRSFRRS